MNEPLASVRIQYSDLAMSWVLTVAQLCEEIERVHDEGLVGIPDEILARTYRVRQEMWKGAVSGE